MLDKTSAIELAEKRDQPIETSLRILIDKKITAEYYKGATIVIDTSTFPPHIVSAVMDSLTYKRWTVGSTLESGIYTQITLK